MKEREHDGEVARGVGALVAAVVVVAATYGYFLIFAEFAFLELLRGAVGEGGLRGAMGALCAGGVAGSALAAWRFRRAAYARALQAGAAVCGGAAVVAGFWANAIVAAVVGVALGWLTVTLAAGLRSVVGERRLGVVVGLGTGLAYAACNVPAVFFASARAQAWMGVALMAVAVVAARKLVACGQNEARRLEKRDMAGWTAVFLALVWLDSAAFYIIQHTPALRAGTWGGSGSLWLNACIHFLVAWAAGVALDRGWRGRVVAGAWMALAAACGLLMHAERGGAAAEVLYTAGVSLYSVALVYVPSRSGRAWVAGVVFAVAGWAGSALGIGMAQDLHAVPGWFLAASGAVVAGVWIWRARRGAAVLLAVLMAVAMGVGEARAGGTAVERGREVYVAEGCIHCHSQYVRAGTSDVERWGPATVLEEALRERPPLFGNRRQGPDLANVGNRRTAEWNRLHLIAPRVVSPGSRMPSYAHLFRDGRGEALVEYLASLGAETVEVRAELVAAWSPAAESWARADAARGGELFARLCVGCHGAQGRGDGVLAERLSVRPPDWSREAWRRVDVGALDESLARVIKFGLPASAMAGHEYLRDDEVVSLARFVRGLHGGPTSK